MADQVRTLITDEDLLSYGDHVRAEVVDGEIVIDMTANKMDHSIYGMQLGTYLNVFVGMRQLGRVGGDMAAFKLEEYPQGGIKGARVPDLFYVSFQRWSADSPIDLVPAFAPDLAIEVISESESHTHVLKKMNEYLDHGAVQVWHILPSLQQVHVFTSNNRMGEIFNQADTLTGGDLLPGFAIPVRAIFESTNADLHAHTLRGLMTS